MRQFITLFRHEIRLLVISPATYVAATLFFVLMGILFWSNVRGFAVTPQEESPLALFYQLFWLPVFFTVPLLTMRSVAEEQRLGTLETLRSTGIGLGSVVIGKFLAAYCLYMLLWSFTLSFPFIAVWQIPGEDWRVAVLDRGPLLGSFLFIAISGLLYIAVGVFTSSLTRSQFVAGMFSFTLLFGLIVGGRVLLDMPLDAGEWQTLLQGPLDYLNVFRHLEDFARGILDTRPLVYYGSSTLLLLGLSVLVLESKT
jgi:ABC-2 type transport system permease protein